MWTAPEDIMKAQLVRSLHSDWLPTLGAICYVFNVCIHIHTGLFLIYLVFWTSFWPLVALSVCWIMYDRETPSKGGRQFQTVKNFPLWKSFRNYFPVSLVKTAELDPKKNYIFCTHPHGLIATSNVVNFMFGHSDATRLFPGLKFHTATLDMNFYIPFLRDYGMALGLVSASSKSLRYILDGDKQGNVVNLMVGGAAELRYSKPGEYKIILNKRKGFIKIALTTGCSLVPVICFGENDCYRLIQPPPNSILSRMQAWIKDMSGACLSIPVGRSWIFNLFPRRVPLVTLVNL